MAWESIVLAASQEAGSDLSADQYRFVTFDSNGQMALSTTGGESIGVLQDKPNAQGQVGSVCRTGDRTKVVFGGQVALGADVGSDSVGRCVSAVSGGRILGKNFGQVGVSGEIGTILFQPGGKL